MPKEDDPGLLILTVSVADQGIGMTDEDKDRVFDEFKGPINPSNRALNPYSNRIGLSFCRRICQAFDGNISVVSVLGQGSQFTFTMVIKQAKYYGNPDDA